MACSLEEIRKDSIETAKKQFIGNSTSFTDEGDNKIFMSDKNFPLKSLLEIAKKNSLRVGKWASNTFGAKFSDNWVFYDEKNNGIEVRINFPKNLEQAYIKKLAVTDSNIKLQEDKTLGITETGDSDTNIEELYQKAMKLDGQKIEELLKNCE